jgi:hypothetical protein
MERYGFCLVAAYMILGGLWMFTRPREAALRNREPEEGQHPPTTGEIWNMRVFGGVFIAAGICFMYAMLMKLPGADFLTP